MVSLKKLMDEQKLIGISDMQIIKQFFSINDLEEEGIDLMRELMVSRIEKMKRKHRLAEEWVSYLPSKYLYENYDLDTANKLHNLELDFLSHDGELSESRLEWAKENVPNILEPKTYFVPLIEWMNNKGIRFKKGE